MAFVDSRFRRKEPDTLIEAISRGLSSEQMRGLVASTLSEMIGENSVNTSIAKLCIQGELNLLRLITIAIYGADPLYGRYDVARVCSIVELQDLMELHIYTDTGDDICIGLSKGSPRIATGCRPRTKMVEEDSSTPRAELRIANQLTDRRES